MIDPGWLWVGLPIAQQWIRAPVFLAQSRSTQRRWRLDKLAGAVRVKVFCRELSTNCRAALIKRRKPQHRAPLPGRGAMMRH